MSVWKSHESCMGMFALYSLFGSQGPWMRDGLPWDHRTFRRADRLMTMGPPPSTVTHLSDDELEETFVRAYLCARCARKHRSVLRSRGYVFAETF